LDEVFTFFSRAENLELLTPPWLRFQIITPLPIAMGVGTLIEYRLRVHGVPLRWMSRIDEWQENVGFVDRQLRGPYRSWLHRHEFERDGERTLVRDSVRYSLPLGALGRICGAPLVRRDLDRVFAFRGEAVARHFG
jgi:ligand-binding SRPBCC domain-containing protein